MSRNLTSLTAKTNGAIVDTNTTKSIYNALLNGREFKGEYDTNKSYGKRNIVVHVTPTGDTVIKEALRTINAGESYSEDDWTEPSLGKPYYNTGALTLTNTVEYPFNNSETIVTLGREMENTNYIVLFGYSDDTISEIEVFDKCVNTFKVKYWGTSNIVNISYVVM